MRLDKAKLGRAPGVVCNARETPGVIPSTCNNDVWSSVMGMRV
jgi:hypothetical protein